MGDLGKEWVFEKGKLKNKKILLCIVYVGLNDIVYMY